MKIVFELIAALAGGIFAGAAVYISLVEHPARLECGPALAVTEFAPSYKRAARMQASLAFLGFLSAVAAWFLGSSPWWLAGGLMLGANIPFTLIVVFPINKQLLNPALDKNSPLARQFLVQWGKLHQVRSLLGLISFLFFLYLLKHF
jgi:uncharacterized membrane protein